MPPTVPSETPGRTASRAGGATCSSGGAGVADRCSLRIRHETAAPELQPVARWALVPDPVDTGDEDSVRDRVGTLNRLPRIVLVFSLTSVGFVKPDRSRVKQKLRPA